MHQLQGTQIGTLGHSCSITASSRQQPGDMSFQIRAIPTSLTVCLEQWGHNKQLAEMIDSIGSQDHIADLTAKVKNLTLTAVHQQDWQHSTTTAVLTAVLPVLILSIIAAGAVAAWKFCSPSISARAQKWNNHRKQQRQPYNLYVN